MSFVYSEEHCIYLPEDFPVQEERELLNAARSRFSSEQRAWREFALGTNLLAWRFRTAHEAWAGFCSSWSQTDGRPDHEEIYVQERYLFEMFTAAVSCMESLVYAAGAALSSEKILSMPFDEARQRKCNPSALAGWVQHYSMAEVLRESLLEIAAAPEWKTLIAVRNRLSHRGNLPRINYAAVGAELPPPNPIEFDETTSSPRLSGDFSAFDILLIWLALSVTGIVEVTRWVIEAASPTEL